MQQTKITRFHPQSMAVALMRAGFGLWATQVVITKRFAEATSQWSQLTRDRAALRYGSAFGSPIF